MYSVFPFFALFLSPHLQCDTLHADPNLSDLLRGWVAALVQIITVFPTSLEDLHAARGKKILSRMQHLSFADMGHC